MSEKRRDKKNRILRTGESQRPDGRYAYKYSDANGKPKFVYSWRLEPGDKLPQGKRDGLSLREKEKQIKRDLEDGIVPRGGELTVLVLVQKYLRQRPNVKPNTEANRKFVLQVIERTGFGARRIDRRFFFTTQFTTFAGQFIPSHTRLCQVKSLEKLRKPGCWHQIPPYSTIYQVMPSGKILVSLTIS